MIHKFKDNEKDLSIFNVFAMIRGHATQDKHGFFGEKGKGGQLEEKLKEYLAATFPKIEDGKRIPMNKTAKNPALSSPNVQAMRFFGQLPIFKTAMDQIIAKPIGVFLTATQGSGMNAFNFMGGGGGSSGGGSSGGGGGSSAGSFQSIITNTLFGSQASLITEGHHLFEKLQTMANTAGAKIGADHKTEMDPATDTAAVIRGVALAFAGGETDPFDTSTYSDGVDMAKEVQTYLKENVINIP